MALRFPGSSPALRERAFRKLNAFRSDEQGAILVMFGLCSLVLFAFVFAAIQYAKASRTDTALQAAADGGALAGARAASENASLSQTDLNALVQKAVQSNLEGWAKNGLTVSVTKTSSAVTVAACSTEQYATALVTSATQQQVCATSVASIAETAAAIPVDIHFLIDTSASMGLAANEEARIAMKAGTMADATLGDSDRAEVVANSWIIDGKNLTEGKVFEGCQFACHTPTGEIWTTTGGKRTYTLSTKSTFQWARSKGIPLRIDAAKSAALLVVDEAEAAIRNGADIKFSVSMFHSSAYHQLPLTSTLGDVRAELNHLDLGYPNMTGVGSPTDNTTQPNTYPQHATGFPKFMSEIARYYPSNRRPYVFLVTDGVKAEMLGKASTGRVSTFPLAACEALKAGATVAVLYLKYLEPKANDSITYNILKDSSWTSIYPRIQPRMQQCASDPSLFAMADDAADISTKMKALFGEILAHNIENGPLRLTQ